MLVCIFVFLAFPLIIGFIASLNLPNIINVDTGALLHYYGVVFGILASFITYYETKQNEKKERLNNIKPLLIIKTLKWESDCLEIEIINASKNLLNDFFLYDKYISASLSRKKRLQLHLDIKDNNVFSGDTQLATDDNIINRTKTTNKVYIDYIQICCSDIDNNMWDCRFKSIIDGDTNNYIMTNCELV